MKFTRQFFVLILLVISIVTYGQNKNPKLTVILFDNQTPDSKVTVDTLLKAKKVNLVKTPIDIFYVYINFHLPYYVPSAGIMKNATKDKECNMKIYPATVKCYEYDKKNRVIKMTVNGSGTMNSFVYKYNDKNQIVEITDNGYDKYLLTYNSNGTLAELKKSNRTIEKKLVFIYE